MSDFISSQKSQFDKIIEFLQKEISGLRIGRATPALVESVMVESYGSVIPLNQLAGINVTDPKTLTIQPWDKNVLKAKLESYRAEDSSLIADIDAAKDALDAGDKSVLESFLRSVVLPERLGPQIK